MKDLTKGNISKVIIQFALPIFLGQIIQIFYGITDTWIIGRILGDNALAAIGSVTPINDLIVGFLIGLTNGFAIITAQFFGAKNKDGLNKSFAASLLFGTLTALTLTIVSLALLPRILRLINISPEHMDNGANYIRVILLGMIASMLYNVFASTLRAMGDTKAPLLFLLISAILNIILDYTLVSIAHMGVAGASIATVISQLVSALLCFIYIYKQYPIMHLTKSSFSFDALLVKKLCTSGLSMGLMSSLVSLGTLFLQSSINTFSTNIIVAHYAARKLTSIFMMPFSILGMTMASYCSQNYGAGNYERIRTGIKKSIYISWLWCIAVIIISYTLVPFLIRAITSTNVDEVIKTGTIYLRVDTPFYFVACMITIFRNALQGIGEHITPIFSSAIELIGKLLTVIILAPLLNYTGIIISEPIVWILMVIPLIVKMKKNVVFHSASISNDACKTH